MFDIHIGPTQTGLAITVIIAFELWTTKLPILLVYLRIFGIRKWLVYFCYTSIAVSGLAYLLAMTPTFMRCHPNSNSTLMDLQYCVTGTTLTGVISGFIALAEDVMIFVLPIPLITGLRLARGKKIALGAVFFSGILYVPLVLLPSSCFQALIIFFAVVLRPLLYLYTSST